MNDADRTRLQLLETVSPKKLAPATFADALDEANAERAPLPPGVVEDVGARRPFTVCDGVRQMMITKIEEWNRYRKLVFYVYVAATAVFIAAIIMLLFNTTRAAGVGTGLTSLLGGAGVLAKLRSERKGAGKEADDYNKQYEKYKCDKS